MTCPRLSAAALAIILKHESLTLSEGFGEQLVNLTDFNLHGCVKLQELPESICNMRSLTKLDLSGDDGEYSYSCGPMSIRALPERFGDLTSLKKVDIRCCPAGENMPATLKEQLQAQGCEVRT